MIGFITFSSFMTALFFGLFVIKFTGAKNEALTQRVVTRLRYPTAQASHALLIHRTDRMSDVRLLDRILNHIKPAKKLRSLILQAGLNVSTGTLVLICFVTGATVYLLFMAFGAKGLLPLLVTLAAMATPLSYAMLRRGSRVKEFSRLFPDAVGRMASSLRAGYSIQMAIEAVVEDSGSLVGQEFQRVLTELEIGQGFEEALKKMLDRMDTADLRLFIASVTIQRQSGGNLAELLDSLEGTIRERFELKRELLSATGQAKLSGIILSLLPVLVGVPIFLINQEYILFLFEDPAGKNLLWLSGFGQMLGFLTIRKIVKIDI
ncbi:MAG: type II secretion system F family protein [Candidatus Omnitrophota bacterium]|nr:type II secretion system F family protein [Candidatus Omnitrophota bacterium]